MASHVPLYHTRWKTCTTNRAVYSKSSPFNQQNLFSFFFAWNSGEICKQYASSIFESCIWYNCYDLPSLLLFIGKLAIIVDLLYIEC